VQKVREAANRTQCANNLKQIGLAVHTFHSANNTLPPDRIANDWITWAVLLMPYLEQDNAYKLWDQTRRYAEQPAAAGSANDPAPINVKTYFCPSRRNPSVVSISSTVTLATGEELPTRPGGLSDYASVSGPANNDGSMRIATPSGTVNGMPVSGNTAFNQSGPGALVQSWKSQTSFSSIADGTSNTILVGEKHVRPNQLQGRGEDRSVYNSSVGNAYRRFLGTDLETGEQRPLVSDPLDQNTSFEPQTRFGSRHPGMCQFVFGDGSVRGVPIGTSLAVLTAISQPADGAVVPTDF
jgi:prepilin-type processing-associated H-X9-DG protein